MLRWCQSTLRALDGNGRNYASSTRWPLQEFAALTQKPYFFRRQDYHNTSINLRNEGHGVEVSAASLVEPQPCENNYRTAGNDTKIPFRPTVSIPHPPRSESSPETHSSLISAPKGVQNPLTTFRECVSSARRSRKGKMSLDSLHAKYSAIQDTTADPDIHLPYFDLLVSSSNSTHLGQAVEHLCKLLERIPDPDPRFPAYLWDLMILYGRSFDKETKQRILQVASYRLGMTTQKRQQTSLSDSVTVPGLTPEIIRHGVVGIPHLSAAFANTLFRCYNPHFPYQFLAQWAAQQARHVLSPQLSLDVRWNNLMLLAVSLSPRNVEVQYNPSTSATLGTACTLWRTALMLETLSRRLPKDKYGFGSQCGKIQGVVRPLFQSFSTAKLANQHIDIVRAYVSTFLLISAKSFDERIKGQCFRLSHQLGLWNYSSTAVGSSRAQAFDLLAAYGTSYIACEGRDWRGLFATIAVVLPDLSWRTNMTNVLMRWYLSENVETAYDLYIHSLETGFDVSQPALAALLTELVNQQRWDITFMFLEHSSTTRENLELIFGQSLTIFQTQRQRLFNERYVRLLADTAFRLYEHESSPSPPQQLKYPIRYLLSMMVWTQNGTTVVKLVDLFRRTAPSFFTPGLMRTLVFDLVRRRDVPNALKLLKILGSIEGQEISEFLEEIRRQLVFKFFKMGARKAALKLRRGKTRIESLSKREALTHVGLSGLPSAESLQHIRRIIAQAKGDESTIREAVSLLLKAKRPWSAIRLYAKSLSTLDPKKTTIIGNMIIHSPMLHKEFCHARLVRRVMKLKNLLVKEYGFTPDRTTLNIIIKCILRWKTMVDSPKVRRLFDHMVHEGYPVPSHFRETSNGVPFGSPHGPFQSLKISDLPTNISFSRHVRPMYKMFIKAFYVRRDVLAAKQVVGILKAVEAEEMREFEKRSRARRDGVIRKRERELKSRRERSRGKASKGDST